MESKQSGVLKDVSRRKFVKWSALLGGTAAIGAGLIGCTSPTTTGSTGTTGEPAKQVGELASGDWISGGCIHNCSCESSRCLLKVYVEDGVPVRIGTDTDSEDSEEIPQKRACLRGYAQISHTLSPARVKYPMKRVNWQPGGTNINGDLRGKDEWERISWDEAIDIFATETKRIVETYGPKSVLIGSYTPESLTVVYWDPIDLVFRLLGAGIYPTWGTVSYGSWPFPEMLMTGGVWDVPDALTIQESELQVHFGFNWAINKSGNLPFQVNNCQKNGAELIVVDPWFNQTTQGLADKWYPVRPGTDTALCLAICYQWIQDNTYDQEYLDKYCIGFDADHMPEGYEGENFKDYVLGAYDSTPKTPEWAASICGMPAASIVELAKKIASVDKVAFFAAQSSSKIPAGEMWAQTFFTMALMHGGIGSPGHTMSYSGLHEGVGVAKTYIQIGDARATDKNIPDPFAGPVIFASPDFSKITDFDAWQVLEQTESWKSILEGAQGRDVWPQGKQDVDVHMIYAAGYRDVLNQNPGASNGIEAFRKMDFVACTNPYFCPSAQYADLVLPAPTWWEKGEMVFKSANDTINWAGHVMEPLYESRNEIDIARDIATAMGFDPALIDPVTKAERTYLSIAGCKYMTDEATVAYDNLVTITEEDIANYNWGADAVPQQGKMSVQEFMDVGIYKTQRSKGDKLSHLPFKAYYDDPVASPLATASGKFEICSPGLAAAVNAYGFSTISPIGKWQVNPTHGQGAQTDEYPLLMWTPHTLHRAHTVFDPVESLAEAHPQACYMSIVDAEARGIEHGDTVLMTSPHGKVLRTARVLTAQIPGAVALEDGAWINIDHDTGIDIGGCPNILQAPDASGQGSQSWTGTLVQVEKYNGPLTLQADKNRVIVQPMGIE